MKFYTLLIAFFIIAFLPCTYAQDGDAPRSAIYFSNPLAINSKARVKLEYRPHPRHGLQLSYVRYYLGLGSLPVLPHYFLAGLEYRFYKQLPDRKSEVFAYSRILYGNDGATGNTPNYGAIFYIGSGRHINLGRARHFFIDLNAGFRFRLSGYDPPWDSSVMALFIGLPLNYYDFTLHFGWQHFSQHSQLRVRQ